MSWLHGCGLSRGESNFCLCTSFFKVVPPVVFHQTSSLHTVTGVNTLFQKLTAGDHIHPYPTNTPHLFVPLSSPLSSDGSSLHRSAPDLHLHPDIALITKQGYWVNYLYCCQYRHKPSPGSALLRTALFYTQASEDSCSFVSPLTSCCWYQLELGQATVKSCPGSCPGPGGSHNTGVSSICRLTGLQQEV